MRPPSSACPRTNGPRLASPALEEHLFSQYRTVARALPGKVGRLPASGLSVMIEEALPDGQDAPHMANPLQEFSSEAPSRLRAAGLWAQAACLRATGDHHLARVGEHLMALGPSAEALAEGYERVDLSAIFTASEERVLTEAAMASLRVVSEIDRQAQASTRVPGLTGRPDDTLRREATREFYAALPGEDLLNATRAAQVLMGNDMARGMMPREERSRVISAIRLAREGAPEKLQTSGEIIEGMAQASIDAKSSDRGGAGIRPLMLITSVTREALDQRLQAQTRRRATAPAEL